MVLFFENQGRRNFADRQVDADTAMPFPGNLAGNRQAIPAQEFQQSSEPPGETDFFRIEQTQPLGRDVQNF